MIDDDRIKRGPDRFNYLEVERRVYVAKFLCIPDFLAGPHRCNKYAAPVSSHPCQMIADDDLPMRGNHVPANEAILDKDIR